MKSKKNILIVLGSVVALLIFVYVVGGDTSVAFFLFGAFLGCIFQMFEIGGKFNQKFRRVVEDFLSWAYSRIAHTDNLDDKHNSEENVVDAEIVEDKEESKNSEEENDSDTF